MVIQRRRRDEYVRKCAELIFVQPPRYVLQKSQIDELGKVKSTIIIYSTTVKYPSCEKTKVDFCCSVSYPLC